MQIITGGCCQTLRSSPQKWPEASSLADTVLHDAEPQTHLAATFARVESGSIVDDHQFGWYSVSGQDHVANLSVARISKHVQCLCTCRLQHLVNGS